MKKALLHALAKLRYFWITMLVAVIMMVIFASTFGAILCHTDRNIACPTWEKVILGIMAILYMVFSFLSIKDGDKDSNDPAFGLFIVALVLVMPILATVGCGFGLSSWIIVEQVSSRWNSIANAHEIMRGGKFWYFIPLILFTYAILGGIIQVFVWIRALVKRKAKMEG